MRGGFIVARCDGPGSRRAVEDHCGPLLDAGPVSQAEWSRTRTGEAVLHAATHSSCYVRDPLMVLSSASEFIVALSRELACRVIGASAEAVSGTFWSTAASREARGAGAVLRRVTGMLQGDLDPRRRSARGVNGGMCQESR